MADVLKELEKVLQLDPRHISISRRLYATGYCVSHKQGDPVDGKTIREALEGFVKQQQIALSKLAKQEQALGITRPKGSVIALDDRGFYWRDPGEPKHRAKAEISESQVAYAREFLKPCVATTTFWLPSYVLSHMVESWCGKRISNGAVIEAVRRAKLPYRTPKDPLRDPNATIAIDKRSLKKAKWTKLGSTSTKVREL